MYNFDNYDSSDDDSYYLETDDESSLETDNLLIYAPEEKSTTKYSLVLCELYNEELHGQNNRDISYLTICRFKEFNTDYVYDFADVLNAKYLILATVFQEHCIYRNYINIIKNDNYIKPEIAECIYLESGHCVCILKTFWIRLIQRKWKNILKEREEIIRRRRNPISLRQREITGMWANDLSRLPLLNGMLKELK